MLIIFWDFYTGRRIKNKGFQSYKFGNLKYLIFKTFISPTLFVLIFAHLPKKIDSRAKFTTEFALEIGKKTWIIFWIQSIRFALLEFATNEKELQTIRKLYIFSYWFWWETRRYNINKGFLKAFKNWLNFVEIWYTRKVKMLKKNPLLYSFTFILI